MIIDHIDENGDGDADDDHGANAIVIKMMTMAKSDKSAKKRNF